MKQALHFSLPDQQLHTAFRTLSDQLNAAGTVDGKTLYELSVANALWGQSGYSYNPQFLQLLKNDYDAQLHEADFVSAAAQAANDINSWVDQKTHGKINGLVTGDSLKSSHALARLFLVNAIYFKGNWESQFQKDETEQQPFHLDAQKDIPVPLMHQREFLPYTENEHLQALEIPYVGDGLSMVVLLPRTDDGLAALEADMTLDKLNGWLGEMRPVEAQIYLPKFKMDREFELADVLSSMGMIDAFSPQQADFSGISTAERMYVQGVIHKAFVDVNEQGTEAAAVTGVVVGSAAVVAQPRPVIFRADHPFIFLIRQRDSGAILFMGRLIAPPA